MNSIFLVWRLFCLSFSLPLDSGFPDIPGAAVAVVGGSCDRNKRHTCYSVISSRRYPPPRSLPAWSMPIPLACLRCWCWLIFFFSFLPFFRFRFGHRLFHAVLFLWVLCYLLGFGICCDSFSIWYTSKCIYVSWYVRIICWSHICIFVWGTTVVY